MKKLYAMLLVLAIAISLTSTVAMAEDSGADKVYTEKDYYGEWIYPEEGTIITITKDSNYLYFCVSPIASGNSDSTVAKYEDGCITMKWEQFGSTSFRIVEEDGIRKLVGGSLVAIWKPDYIANATKYAIGESSSTDTINFKITKVEYVKKIDAKTAKPISSGTGLGAGDNMVFAHVIFSIENNSKETIRIPNLFQFTVDYNDGFLFSTEDGNYCYYKDKDASYYYSYCRGAGSGSISSLSPLCAGDYEVYIPVANVVSTNTTNPIIVITTVPSSNGMQEIYYKVQ